MSNVSLPGFARTGLSIRGQGVLLAAAVGTLIGLIRLAALDFVNPNPLFHPHGYCYMWERPLVGSHVISDLIIGGSYVAISITLAYLVYRARRDIPFGWMMLIFGAF